MNARPVEIPTEIVLAIGRGSLAVTSAAIEQVESKRVRKGTVTRDEDIAARFGFTGYALDRTVAGCRHWPIIDDALAYARGLAVLKAGGLDVLTMRVVQQPLTDVRRKTA